MLKLRRLFQLTLPTELRKQFHQGDYLEAEATEAGILLKPVRVVERQKARGAWERCETRCRRRCLPSKNARRRRRRSARRSSKTRDHDGANVVLDATIFVSACLTL